jgi:beta-lactamase class A
MTIDRRKFISSLGGSMLVSTLGARAHAAPAALHERWRDIESACGGRLGVAVFRKGELHGNRVDERFPMCSTFKWLAAACVLRRVDAGSEDLQRRVHVGSEVLLPYSPVTEKHAGGSMTVAELCHAAVAVSDNAAGNLLLASFGGPKALTGYARSLGDTVTRLDRWEPDLNQSVPGDPRDTTSPRAMAQLLRRNLLGDALSETGRRQLTAWMEATVTDGRRLRSGLPSGWRVASKTGTGEHGSTNSVGVFWTPAGEPIVVAVYIAESAAPLERRESAIAAVARRVIQAG